MRHGNPTRMLRTAAALALAGLLVAAGAFIASQRLLRPTALTAIFTTAPSIYPGDDVRIAGVKVGTISAIVPDGTRIRLFMEVDHGVRVPADAAAVIVAQNLVSARFVQLTPPYSSGPAMPDGAEIPIERTAVPVEWDEVKEQLTRLATDLGPSDDETVSTGSVGNFIDKAADAMDGNGEKLRLTLSQLSGVGRILADGSGDITEIVQNLQTFVSALRDSNQQIVQFEDRLATLTSVLDGGRSDLDAALTNLSDAVSEVTRFVNASRAQTSEQVQRLANVTQNLVDHQDDLEQILHVAPTAYTNAYNMMDPRTGGASGVFVLNNMSDPRQFICGMIGAIENVTAPATAELCSQTLGPALDAVDFNYLPFPFNPMLTSVPSTSKLIYSEPKLMPGNASGAGETAAPAAVPGISAYTGAPADPPAGSPAHPAPPAAPEPPSALQEMLLPAERPPS